MTLNSYKTFPLPTRSFGSTHLPRLGLGLSALGHPVFGIPGTDAERLAFLDAAFERGERFWDTADAYGDCEDLLGKWFARNVGKREHVFLATMFSARINQDRPVGEHIRVDSSPEYCHQAIDRSLSRLGLRYVDLYYVYRLDKTTPVENTIEAMVELKRAGKIKYLGLSECSAESLRRAHAVHSITAVQVEYSPFCLAIEDPKIRVLEAARDMGIAIVAFSPLGNGFLTGRIRHRSDVMKEGDQRGGLPWLQEENLATNVAIVDKLSGMAKHKGISTAQLALAWVLAQGDDVFAIPGTTSVHRLEENLAAMDVRLSKAEESAVRDIARGVAGKRFQDLMGYSWADTPALESSP